MGEIKVVEYNHSYAKAVAEMWNRSSENWGGYNTVNTEESVIKTHNSTSCLNVFLAVDGDRVAGYCSFSEYREDGGALYIPLLNADPEYHGQGVGKELVLRAVERTLELDWPRLDLYTWPGNTKAVPLYKKCGFFWEKKDDTTHLINLIPTVLKTEAVRDYFEEADWYRDSKRLIEIKHDGISEGGFEYFEYQWEKDNKALRMQFEKTGRGLRLIETDDYLISATIEEHSLVFGRTYIINYTAVNKSGAPLEISIRGLSNKNIDFNLVANASVCSTENIKGEFYVDKITEEQNEFRNHPTVDADVFINGKKATFKVGILPKFPCKFKLEIPRNECFLNSKQEMFIDVENNFDEEAVFQLNLASNKNIEYLDSDIEVSLKSKERKSIQVSYILKNYHVFNSEVPIYANLKSGETIEFSTQLSGFFKGSRGIFWGETDKSWHMVNGSVDVKVEKFDNCILPIEYRGDSGDIVFMYPQIGKPFSDELSKIKPENVEFKVVEDTIFMKSIFKLKDFPGISFASITKLYSNGIAEYYNEIANLTDSITDNEVWINQRIYFSLSNIIIPYDNSFVEMKFPMSYDYEHWNSEKLKENWLFSRGDKKTRGICWSPKVKMNFDSWFCYTNLNLGLLSPGEVRKTEPIHVAVGAFSDWKEFRKFALNTHGDNDISTRECFEIKINDGNPFAKESIKVAFSECRQTKFEGTIEIESRKKSFEKVVDYIDGKAKDINTEDITIALGEHEDIVRVVVDYESNAMELSEEKTVFTIGGKEISTNQENDGNYDVFSVDNDVFVIKAAPAFSNCLYSLECKNREWLDSSYPKAIPKSWYNPWTGGISTMPISMNYAGILEETRIAEFIERVDNKGNQWKGIRISTRIDKNKTFKDLEISQYFMLLPGVPVLCHFVEVYNNMGRLLNEETFENISYLKLCTDIKNTYVKVLDKEGKEFKFKSGRLGYDLSAEERTVYGSNKTNEKLIIVSAKGEDCESIAFVNNQITAWINVQKLYLKHGESMCTKPMFSIITTEEYTKDQLSYLKNIRFE